MDTPEISICISVFNTEKYLGRCLDSIINQTFKSIEIILVNNGSTDSSFEIMQTYKKKYPNYVIKIVEQEDMGLAQGRQSGVNNASGRYIGFLDADDFVVNDAYECLYNCITAVDADIVEGRTIRDGKIMMSPYEGVMSSKEVLKDHFLYGNSQMMLWLRLYKRELFDFSVFPSDYVNNEDNYAFPCLLFRADTISYCDYVFHHYSSDNEQAVMNMIIENKYDEEKIKHNRLMLLKSFVFVENYIGKMTIKQFYFEEFNAYICRMCVGYCTYSFKSISLTERCDTVFKILGMTKVEFQRFYRSVKKPDSRFERLARIVGIHWAIKIFDLYTRLKLNAIDLSSG